jgi:hypothetical protein
MEIIVFFFKFKNHHFQYITSILCELVKRWCLIALNGRKDSPSYIMFLVPLNIQNIIFIPTKNKNFSPRRKLL